MSDLEPSREHPRVPGPSLWPVGLALGIVVLLVGLVHGLVIVALGVAIVFVFALLWARDVAQEQGLADSEMAAPEASGRGRRGGPSRARSSALTRRRATRARSSSRRRPSAWAPRSARSSRCRCSASPCCRAFLNQGEDDHDLGPLENYPEGEWMIATSPTNPEAGDVSRISVFVRYNGVVEHPETKKPSRASRSSPTTASISAARCSRTAPTRREPQEGRRRD